MDKEQANFCTYFRPRPHAHAPANPAVDSSRAALDALFGLDGEDSSAPRAKADPKAAARRAREELDALFDLEKDPDSRGGESSG